MTAHKSTVTKSAKSHAHATTTEVEASAPVETTATTASEVAAPTPNPADVASLAKQASALLNQISAFLPFDDPSVKDAKASMSSNRVPTAALTIASSILSANPGRFPDLDPAAAKSAIDYDQALSPLVLQLQQLQQRTAKTLFYRRSQGALQTLVLYQVLKGLSRVTMNKATLVQQKQLEKLLKTNRKVRATSVTKKELKTVATGMKVTKKSAVKAAKAATANAEAQQAAAIESAVLGGATGATAPAAQASSVPASPAPAASSPAPAAPAAGAVASSH